MIFDKLLCSFNNFYSIYVVIILCLLLTLLLFLFLFLHLLFIFIGQFLIHLYRPFLHSLGFLQFSFFVHFIGYSDEEIDISIHYRLPKLVIKKLQLTLIYVFNQFFHL